MTYTLRAIIFAWMTLAGLLATAAPPKDVKLMSKSLSPFVDCLAEKRESYNLVAHVDFETGGKKQVVEVGIEQISADSFNLEIKHEDYWAKIERRPNRTALILPLHKVAFVGEGKVSGQDTLKPRGLVQRLVGQGSNVGLYLPLITGGDSQLLSLMLTSLLNPKYDADTNTWSHKNEFFLQFDDEKQTIFFRSSKVNVRMALKETAKGDTSPLSTDGLTVTKIPREEIERHLSRGIRRAFEVLSPSPLLTNPSEKGRHVAHGELRWIDGHRVALLQGTPEQIGKAHGQLLKDEAHHCIDSVMYAFGTFQTIRSGKWFKHELESAYERLAPHIPERHKRETDALAKAIGVEPKLAQAINVFPELFHCSGFALFGKATADGKLYHGRVLDYMTTIGLQDSSVTMIIAPQGHHAFATVGYAGFIGSVSGMNAQGISLGEMGGRGEGQWDGVPMATLMRRALEECDTLDEVKSLWSNSPRTCEYYYVFADGKTNDAVGVSATPEAIEFVAPGQSHPLLGDGIEDTVLLSSGSRLEKLRSRVKERYGKFDTESAKWLMSRPVAMESNLHNVLFVPEDGLLFVANASHQRPAAERPYVRLDLRELLESMDKSTATTSQRPGK